MIKDMLFTEKYRPKKFDEVIGLDSVYWDKFRENPYELPHLLLVGSPGIGKTTLAKVIANELDSDVLYLNASDERGIDVVRNKVKNFASTTSFNTKSPKIIHLDEADGLTPDAQNVLRNIMEEYSSNARFVLTANNESKITEPIKSRTVRFNMALPDKEKILERLMMISELERIQINLDSLINVVETYYPDIRSMVKHLQYLKLDIAKESYEDAIIVFLIKKEFTNARTYWISNSIDYKLIIQKIYKKLMDEEYSTDQKAGFMYACCEAICNMQIGVPPEIAFACGMMRIIQWM